MILLILVNYSSTQKVNEKNICNLTIYKFRPMKYKIRNLCSIN